MVQTLRIVFAGTLLLLAGYGFALAAETYQWEDSQGTPHFTDDLTKVPPSERDKVRVLPIPDPLSRPPVAGSPPPPQPDPGPMDAAGPLPVETGGPRGLDAYGKCRLELSKSTKRMEKQLTQDQARLEELNRMIHRTVTSRHKNRLQRERAQVKKRILEAERVRSEDLPRMEWECERQRSP